MNAPGVVGRTWEPRATSQETFVLLGTGKQGDEIRFPSLDGRTPRKVVRLSVPDGSDTWRPFVPVGYKPAEQTELRLATLSLVDERNTYLVRDLPLLLLWEQGKANRPFARYFAGIVPSWERSYVTVYQPTGVLCAFPLLVDYLDT